MKKFLLFVAILVCAFCVSVGASSKLSPAIDVIASENSMVKAGVMNNGEIGFDVDDFDMSIGANVSYITVASLPSEKYGRLMLDNLYVLKNQVIKREDFSMLRFVSKGEGYENLHFTFKPNGNDYEIVCQIKPITSVNLSPVASNGSVISAWTFQDTSYFGTLKGYDPEGDSLTFEVVSYPEKGLLYQLNKKTGDYRYVPYMETSGNDSFTYVVRDSYGNYSEKCKVEIEIEKTSTKLVVSDLENDKYLNAITVVYENDLMTFKENEDKTLSFNPNEEITREEFLVLVMRAMGAKNVPVISRTRFADDGEISPEYKGYLESAFSLGIIKGENKTDGVYINPKDKISLADASVIINNIIGAKIDTSLTVFADSDEIPDYARESIASLCELGILSKVDGKINPNSPLTRAQVANILMSLLKLRGK